jgi:hypothetical protein
MWPKISRLAHDAKNTLLLSRHESVEYAVNELLYFAAYALTCRLILGADVITV